MWEQLKELFAGSTANHGATDLTGDIKESGKKEARSYTVAGEPSAEQWQNHFNGKWPSLGIIPLQDDGRSIQFAALDIDVYKDIDAVAIERKLTDKNIPGLITRSKSGGVHVWFFFSKPISAKPIIAKLSQIAAYLGYGNAEKFPPTGERLQDHDVGYWINLPFHGSERRGFINGKSASFKQFYTVAKKKIIKNQAKFLSLDTGLKEDSTFADGPPCLQRLDQEGIAEGMRNNALFEFGLYLYYKYEGAFQAKLLEYNSGLDEPLSSTEIQRIADSIQGKDSYYYSCNKEPLCSRCDRKTCMNRPYGIGKMQGAPLQGVTVGNVTQLLTDPAILIVDLNEVRVQLPDGFKTFLSQAYMRNVCADFVDIYPPKVAQKQWDEFVSDLVQHKNKIDVPEDSTPKGRLREHLKDFITKRQTTERDHLLNSGVWINEDGKYALRLLDFISYLKREGFVMIEGEIVAVLKEMESETQRMKVKGRDINVWIVKPGSIQTDEYDVKDFEPNY